MQYEITNTEEFLAHEYMKYKLHVPKARKMPFITLRVLLLFLLSFTACVQTDDSAQD